MHIRQNDANIISSLMQFFNQKPWDLLRVMWDELLTQQGTDWARTKENREPIIGWLSEFHFKTKDTREAIIG